MADSIDLQVMSVSFLVPCASSINLTRLIMQVLKGILARLVGFYRKMCITHKPPSANIATMESFFDRANWSFQSAGSGRTRMTKSAATSVEDPAR